MIQDIGSSRFDITFENYRPEKTDYVLRFDQDGRIWVDCSGDCLVFPKGYEEEDVDRIVYLFSVDEVRYFLLLNHDEIRYKECSDKKNADLKITDKDNSDESELYNGFLYKGLRELRRTCCNVDNLIVFTAYHLWRWYMDHHFCGRCGGKLKFKDTERALVCECCENTIYPRINPAVIVGVINGDSILITRYQRGYAHNALVAGFVEIGETLEQTVCREVMEETGIRVRNIRYYKSQPWGMAQDVLMGFFCNADDYEIKMDENELRFAGWVRREDIELQPDDLSLTNEMMMVFKEGKIEPDRG